ncbi:multiheme c-type cytochrome [Planctomicrobium sp. SH664]|uniref:multiheme c-type cytochrome n=1 Tax=Planctomicrobium sp. SH664 TaxID=3448125 RepID=UPI003F5BA8A4
MSSASLRWPARPVWGSMVFILAVAVAAFVLVPRSGSSQGGPAASTQTTGTTLLADWVNPVAALVFTGDVHGYLEPCGCSERQSGGFARRADLIRQLREVRQIPTVAFDVGGSLNDSRISYPQTKYKFAAMLKGLNEMGAKGIALGKEELMLGAPELFTQHANSSAENKFDVPFLGANTTLFGTPSEALGTPTPTRIIQVGPARIGVVAIAGNTVRRELQAAGVLNNPTELQVDEPAPVLAAAIQKLTAEKPDYLVLLSHAEMEESKQLAQAFPQFQIVVTSGSAEDPRPEPVYIGKTMLVQVGKKGKNAAVVGIFPDRKLRYALLELDMDRFQNHPQMVALMEHYQNQLKEAWPELSAQEIPDPATGTFVGVEACKSCHEGAYDVWKDSNHALAYEHLITGRKGQKEYIPRIYDPECLCCHTTGWDPQRALRHASGFIDMERTPLLAGQQCENCHGPGSNHVNLEKGLATGALPTPEVLAARKAMHLDLETAKNKTCTGCHDLDNSPKFEFDHYWNEIAH